MNVKAIIERRVLHVSHRLRDVGILLDKTAGPWLDPLRSALPGERRHNLPRPLRHFILAQGPLG